MKRNVRFSIKNILILMLAAALLLPVLSCASDRPEPTYDTRLNLLSTNGMSIYTIVRPDFGSSKEVLDAAVSLRDAMQEVLGTTVGILTDFEEDKNADVSLRYEILVGKTNRAESASALEGLERDEYVVRVVGHKIVIVGESDRATAAGVDYFLSEVLHYQAGMQPLGADARIDEKMDVKGIYTVPCIRNEVNNMITCAKYRATTFFQIAVPGNASDALTLGTLQGLTANSSSEQILLKAGAQSKYTPYLKSGWDVKIKTQTEDGKDWTLELLLAYFAKSLGGYILCDADLKGESAGVAVSIANQLNAVVVTPDNKAKAEAAGLSCLLDVTGKDDAWLRSSPYFEKLSRKVAVEQPTSMAPKLIDYAVMAGCYLYFYNDRDSYTHEQKFKFLDDGAVVVGWNNTLGEYETVASLSRQNIQMIPADHCYNLSVLSGFSTESMKPAKASAASDGTASGVHTVCFILSDGDNLQWTLNDYTTSAKWYGSPLRGVYPMTWGLPATLIDTAAPMLSYFYDTATTEDEFLLQLSGLGYTYPSKWSEDARSDMAKQVAAAMKRMNMKYMEVLDDKAFSEDVLDEFAVQKEIEGIFYIDYSNYAGEAGKILWSCDTPIVSARYRLWAGVQGGSIDEIAKSINAASTDPTKQDAYSFIIVHAWSGLGDGGELVANGDTMAGVEELILRLDDDVEVVSASEFMARVKKNLQK